MEVSRTVLEQVYTEITTSVGYITTVGPVDKSKVSRRRAGEQTKLPSAKLARAAWRVAALLAPLTPPPPPPPPAVLVAPITVTQQGASDQRVCLFNADGSLRPGVWRLESGEYTDQSNAKYKSDGDGLENSSVRTKLPEGAFGLVKAKEMDNRSACQCPTAGSPTDNTGSWTV